MLLNDKCLKRTDLGQDTAMNAIRKEGSGRVRNRSVLIIHPNSVYPFESDVSWPFNQSYQYSGKNVKVHFVKKLGTHHSFPKAKLILYFFSFMCRALTFSQSMCVSSIKEFSWSLTHRRSRQLLLVSILLNSTFVASRTSLFQLAQSKSQTAFSRARMSCKKRIRETNTHTTLELCTNNKQYLSELFRVIGSIWWEADLVKAWFDVLQQS